MATIDSKRTLRHSSPLAGEGEKVVDQTFQDLDNLEDSEQELEQKQEIDKQDEDDTDDFVDIPVTTSPTTTHKKRKTKKSQTPIANDIQDARGSLKIPIPPATELRLERFEKWLAEIDATLLEEIWNNRLFLGYLYREYPVINRQLADPDAKNYIDKLSDREGFSKDYLLKTHGGGRFHIDLTDITKKKGAKICTVRYSIPISEADPILNLRELELGNRDNKSYIEYLQNKGILDMTGKPMQQHQQGNSTDMASVLGAFEKMVNKFIDMRQSNNQPNDLAMQKAIDMLGKTYETAMMTAVKADSGADVDKLTKLMAMAKEMLPKSDNRDSSSTAIASMYEKMLDMTNKSHEVQLQLMKQMMDMNTRVTSSKNDEDDIEKFAAKIAKLKELAETFSGTAGVGSGIGEGHKWYDSVFQYLPNVLGNITQLVGHFVAAKQGQQVASQQVQQQPIPQATRVPLSPSQMLMQSQEQATSTNDGNSNEMKPPEQQLDSQHNQQPTI